VVNTILNTPVTMKIGEVLASSQELSDQLSNMIKYKNAKQGTVNHAVVLPKDSGKLIWIPLRLGGQQVTGIIDTGSELNVINRRITRGLTEAPVNPQRKVVMNDANGGAGNLQGHISGVSLKCGSVETFANLYVGDAVPFDLLLGRPWQRDNLVSIDERIDGTYLVFKDPKNIEVTYELLVEDHAPRPHYPFDIRQAPEVMKADFLGMMIMSSRGVENLPGEELTESSEGGNHDSPDSTHDSPRNISSTSVMSGKIPSTSVMSEKIPGTSVMSGKIPSTSVTPEATLGTGGTGMMEVTTLLECSGENKGDSLRPGNTPMGSPGTLGTEMLPLFHLHTNLNFMRKSLRHQEKLITEAIAKHSSGLALHSGWESLEYMYGPKARMLGLSGAFNKAMQRFCFDLVRRVRGEIMDKYLEDSQSPQNDITPRNQQQATSSIFGMSGRHPTETLPHFRLLSIPGNDVPPHFLHPPLCSH
jgi:hypothetical protein